MKYVFQILAFCILVLSGCDTSSNESSFKLELDNQSSNYFQVYAKKTADPISAYLSTSAFTNLDPKIRSRMYVKGVTSNFGSTPVTFNTSYDLVLVPANDTRTNIDKFNVAEKYKRTITLKSGGSLYWAITD